MDGILLVWSIIGIIALTVDLITSAFIFIWFTVGAIAAVIANLLGCSTAVQILLFIVVSALFTAVGYPFAKKTIKKTVAKTPTTEEGYIGRQFTIENDIVEKSTMKIDGIYWTVRNDGEAVKKGDKVQITGIEGNKLLIRKI